MNAFRRGASLTLGSVGVGTIRASAFMHFLGTEVQGRQLVFLTGLRTDHGRRSMFRRRTMAMSRFIISPIMAEGDGQKLSEAGL